MKVDAAEKRERDVADHCGVELEAQYDALEEFEQGVQCMKWCCG